MNLTYATLIELLETSARLSPEATACTVLDEAQEVAISWQELRQKSRAVAIAIRDVAAVGDRVIVVLPPGIDLLIAFFGCLYAKVIAVLVSPPKQASVSSHLHYIIDKTSPILCLSSSNIMTHMTHLTSTHQWPVISKMASLWHKELLSLPGFAHLAVCDIDAIDWQTAVDYQDTTVDANTTALIQYTSGATGRPKGVVLTHHMIMANLAMNRLATQMNTRDICLSWLSPYYADGLITGLLQPMYCHAPVYIMPTHLFIAQPFRWLQAIMTHKASISGAPDFAWQLCLDIISDKEKKQLDLSSWELAFCGGDLVHPQVLDHFYRAFRSCGIRKNIFYASYGLTEATAYAFGSQRNQGILVNHVGSQALPSYDCSHLQAIRIVNPESLTECAVGDVGEIWLSGSSVAKEYWQEPLLTKTVFDNYINGQGPFLRTGDLGCLDNNRLIVMGRCAEIITIDNNYYYPQPIERDVGDCHSNLLPNQVAAIGVSQGLVIIAAVEQVNKDRAKAIFSTISRCILANHGLYVPTILLIAPETLKKTDNGKIKRLHMRHLYVNNKLDILYRYEQKTTAMTLACSPKPDDNMPNLTSINTVAPLVDKEEPAFLREFILNEKPDTPPYIPDAIDLAIRGDSIPLAKSIPLADYVDDYIERQLFSQPLDSD